MVYSHNYKLSFITFVLEVDSSFRSDDLIYDPLGVLTIFQPPANTQVSPVCVCLILFVIRSLKTTLLTSAASNK